MTSLSAGPPLELTEDDPRDACAALRRAARRFADHGVVTVTEEGTVRQTYPELLARADRLLGGLRARGARPGDPVVLRGLALADFFPAFWACLLGGLVPVAMSEDGPPAESERLGHVRRLLGGPLVLTAGDELHEREPAGDAHRPDPDDLAVLVLSSGSTGRPKAVRLTHRALALAAAGCGRAMGIRPEHVTLNWLPIDHSGALLLYHLNSVFAGATNVHVSTELVLGDPLRWLDLMAEHGVRHSWAPTFGFQLVVDALARTGRHWDLSRVRTLVCGGEQVVPAVVETFLAATGDFGLGAETIVPAWGMTETASAVTYGRFAAPDGVRHVVKSSLDGELVWADETTDERDRATFVVTGRPVAGVAVRVVDAGGDVLPERRIGRLQVSSPRVTPGYLDDEEADRAAFPHGDRTWLDTGDLAFVADGAVTITGRAKDVIILNGHNHFCHEIEDVVRSAGVGEAGVAACGVPDPATGSEELVVFAVGTGDEKVVREALFRRLRIGRCRVVFLPGSAFPRTPSGKVRRAELRERLLAGRYDAPRHADPTTVVREVVASVVGHEVDEHTPFFELGMTSVTLARMRTRLAAELRVAIPPTAPFRHPTVADLAAHLSAPPAGAAEVPVPPAEQDQRVAVIGMAVRFPGARTVEEFWANLRAGVDSVRTFGADELAAAGIPDLDDPALRPVGGVLDDVTGFDEGFFGISPREAELTDPAHRQFLECCYHALEHAGYAGAERGHRVGVFAGSGMHLYGHQDEAGPGLAGTIGSEPDFLATRVAYRLGFTGPAVGVRTACSTSLVAVHLAVRAVLAGDAEIAVAGAAAVRMPQEAGYRHEPGSILSASGRCRAFDAAADGTVGGNGVAAVVLKPLRAALADGDRVHAVILGSAVNNDGRSKVGFTAPSVPGQAAVIRQALDRAGVPADTVTYVEAHGTGTELGDPVEFDALCEAFRSTTDRVGFCALGSVKPNVGHLDSCAGMAGLVKTVLMLRHRELVATVNLATPNPVLRLAGSPFVLATERREWTVPGGPRRAGVSAFGVGGTNAHVVLEEPPPVEPGPADTGPVLVPLSAADPDALEELAGSVREHLLAHPELRAADVASTLALGRRHLPFRASAVGGSPAELAGSLTLGERRRPVERLVFAFAGQGRVPSAAALYRAFPVVRRVLDECERACPGVLGLLVDGGEGPAQPALFAYQAALVELWRSVGVEPALVTGHSLGEYAALYTAGALSLVDGVRLVAARGRAMEATEPGGMLAVNAGADVVRRVAESSGTEIAAVNGSSALTLSGPVAAVERAAELLGGSGCRRLEVEVAFHSALVEPALPKLRHEAELVDWRPLRLPLVSGVDGGTRPVGTVVDGEVLCRHAREPVRFDLVLSALDGADVVEVGPGEVLAPFARRVDPGARWFAHRDRDPVTAFLSVVGELYRSGVEIDWAGVVGPGGRRVPLPAYPFRRAKGVPEAPRSEEAVAEVRRLTAHLLGTPVEAVDPDRTFVAMGADSLTLMSMVRDLNETHGTQVPVRHLFDEADTPRKLAALLGPRPGAAGNAPARPGSAEQPAAADQPPAQSPPAPTKRPEPPAPEQRPEPPAPEQRPSPPAPEEPPAPPASEQRQAPPEGPVPPGEVRAVVERQLALAERMVDRMTALMSDQLAALGASSAPGTPLPADAPPAPPDPPPAPPVPPVPPAPPAPATAPAPPPISRPTPGPPPPATAPPPAPVPPRSAAAPRSTSAAAPHGHRPSPATTTTPHAAASPAPARPGTAAFSLYFFGDYPDQDQTDKYQLITSAARFADRHGFHALWLPERHFHSFGALFPNPSVLAAALAAQTERVRLHAGSVVLPLHHPVRVAEEWSVVDNLSGGRVGLCVASGWHATDFVLAPENYGRHRELMYDHLDTVRRLWAGEAVTATAGSGDEVDVRLHPRPIQDSPPMFVAVVSNPDSYRLAAEHDLGVVTNLMAQDVDQLAANIALYRRTRAEAGLGPGRVVVLVHTYLGDDLDRVRREAFRPFVDYLRSSLSLFNQVTNSLGIDVDLDATPADDVDFLLERAYRRYCDSRALIGTRDSCAPVVDRLIAAGADEIACFVDFGVPREKALAGLSALDELRAAHALAREPLSAAQRRIWFLDRLYPGQTIYHEPKAIRFTGPLDVTALRAALQRVVDRQPSLRTVFRDEGGEPYRVVLPSVELDCPLVERPGVPEEQVLREALRDLEVFDLATGPLLSARLFRLTTEHHLLFLSAHHIVFDSASTAVLLADLAAYYRAFPAEPDLPALPVPDEQTPAGDLGFWRERLSGAPVLRLPTDHPRPPTRSGHGAGLTHHLDAELADRLDQLGRATGVTMFMTLLGAIAAVLGRFAGQHDVVLGTAVANRPRGTEGVVGLLLDTVALRVDLAGDPTFTELATRVRDTTMSAYEHQVPFDELVRALNPERDPASNPLFDVLVEYENEAEVDFAPPVAAVPLDVPADRAPFDLALYLTRHPGGVRVGVEYDTDLFTRDTLTRVLDLLELALRRAADTPAARLSELTAPTPADAAALTGWQGGSPVAPECLHLLVERQVDRTPDAVAVVTGATELTYRELDERANQVANALLAAGIGRGDLVAVRLPRGPELVAALLGVLKSGAAYLPIDPALPEARAEYLVRDSGARPLPPAAAERARPDVPVDPRDPAYCIYTSGSTGRPKGVLVPHRGPANVVRWQAAQHPPLRTLQWTSPSFDVSVQEIFSTLATGASLVLVDDELRYDPTALAGVLLERGVERIFMPYTPLKYLMETGPRLPAMRVVVSAGEALALTPALRGFLAAHPECELYNQYGPTEGSIIVTSHRVDPTGPATPPIGVPIDGVTVAVLDQRREPVPVGAVGEIHIGGTAVATGYLGRPRETAAAFVADPRRPGARLYRTGDLGRWRGDGTVEFLGRRDDQVKIRGYRVEPGEAERALADLDGVRDCAVVVRRDRAGEPELVAYVVPDQRGDLDAALARLRTLLPGYLVPTRWVPLERLPVNASGKLDTGRLPEPSAEPGGAEPATELERTLHELWCAELGRSSAPVDRSFFSLGGHSLSAVRLLNRLAERVGRACSMAEFFANPSVRALAGVLADPVSGSVSDLVPTTSRQRRLWRRHHELTDPAVYNVTHRIDLNGPLDEAALRRALDALVARHDALRTRLVDERAQEFIPPFPVELPVDEVADADLDAWCLSVAAAPFALDRAPLLRLRMARLGPDRRVLVLVLHHMVCDGWSLGILWRELSALYAGVEPPPAPSFADYARWDREQLSGRRGRDLDRFWREELAGAELTLRLPTDRPRPPALSGRGDRHESVLAPSVAAGVRAAAAELGSTPYAVLATAFAVWAARLCRQPDLVLPTSAANRARPEHEGLVGLLGDAVPVRVRLDRVDFRELVREVSVTLYTALDHGDLPLTEIVGQVPGAPLPNLLFTVVTDPPPAPALDGVEVTVRELAVPRLARNELYVRLAVTDEAITACWEYSTDVLDHGTVLGWDSTLHRLLAELVSSVDAA